MDGECSPTKEGCAAETAERERSQIFLAQTVLALIQTPVSESNVSCESIFTSQSAGQCRYLVASNREAVVHQEWIRQPGPVERAVNLHGHDGLAIAFDRVHDIQRDIDGEDFAIGPFFDRSDAAKLPPHVFDDGIRRKAGLERSGIMGIDGPDAGFDGLRQFHFLFQIVFSQVKQSPPVCHGDGQIGRAHV